MDENKAVLTTRFIAVNHSEILSVYHELDDSWQFMGKEDVTEADAMILSIAQILKIDSSVKDVLDIKKGYSAHRNTKYGTWTIQKDG